MLLIEVLWSLEELGTEQNRTVYKRHGAKGAMYGVSITNLHKLKKAIKTDHNLAIELWQSGNMDARCLATLIADPKTFSHKDAFNWINDCDYYVLADFLANNLICKCSFNQQIMEELIRIKAEWPSRIGWKIMENFANSSIYLPDAYFLPFLEKIRTELHQNENRSKEAMNKAIIAIGKRNENLNKISLSMVCELGKVYIDHGNTACKTPDAQIELSKCKIDLSEAFV